MFPSAWFVVSSLPHTDKQIKSQGQRTLLVFDNNWDIRWYVKKGNVCLKIFPILGMKKTKRCSVMALIKRNINQTEFSKPNGFLLEHLGSKKKIEVRVIHTHGMFKEILMYAKSMSHSAKVNQLIRLLQGHIDC